MAWPCSRPIRLNYFRGLIELFAHLPSKSKALDGCLLFGGTGQERSRAGFSSSALLTLGLGHSLGGGGCPGHCGALSSTPGPTYSMPEHPSPSCDNQTNNVFRHCPMSHGGKIAPQLTTAGLGRKKVIHSESKKTFSPRLEKSLQEF